MIPKGHSPPPYSSHTWSLNAVFVDVSFPRAGQMQRVIADLFMRYQNHTEMNTDKKLKRQMNAFIKLFIFN